METNLIGSDRITNDTGIRVGTVEVLGWRDPVLVCLDINSLLIVYLLVRPCGLGYIVSRIQTTGQAVRDMVITSNLVYIPNED